MLNLELRTLITLPFVALFAALLLALGWILARDILADVESRVENEQRFMLSVAASPGWPLGEESLRRIRNRAALPSDEKQREGFSEFIVLQNGTSALTTLARGEANGRALADTLLAELKAHPELEPGSDAIQLHRVQLAGQDFLLLATQRAVRGTNPSPRRFFLLHPYNEIEQAKNRALHRIVSLGAAGLALAAALGLVLGHWISRPVRQLAAAAKRVTTEGLKESTSAEFESEHTALERAGGEIGELARAFRSMIESLRRSQADLLKAERLAATGKLAACVAHEIRNPLTSLRMTVQMLQSVPASFQQSNANTQEAYRILLTEIDRLSLAVEELMTVARPRPPQKEPTDLNALMADTLRFMERQLAHAKISARLEADATLPRDLLVDPNKLRQVVINLILNAMQAIVRGGEIVVRTRWDLLTRAQLESHALPSPREREQQRSSARSPTGEGNGNGSLGSLEALALRESKTQSAGRVILEVQDSGGGIAPEIRETLFDLFVSTKSGGGGLGLAVAKQIAEEHGGSICFETVPGRTVFRVELPT